MASFSICETTSFEVQTRDIHIPLRGLSIIKQMLLLQFNVRMMYSTKEKSFSQRFHIRYLEKSEWSLINQNKVQWFAVTKWRQLVFHHFTIENFSFEDKYEYEIKLKVFARVLQEKRTPQKASFYCFSPKTLGQLFVLKKVKPSPDTKMIKHLTLNVMAGTTYQILISCSRHYHILAKTPSSMTMTITFSHQNDAGSIVNNTQY